MIDEDRLLCRIDMLEKKLHNASVTSASTIATAIANDDSAVGEAPASDSENSNGEECDGNQNVSSVGASIGDT